MLGRHNFYRRFAKVSYRPSKLPPKGILWIITANVVAFLLP